MIEKFFTALIAELQTTGILLLGLYGILIHVAREISRPLKVLNHNSTAGLKILERIIEKLDKK